MNHWAQKEQSFECFSLPLRSFPIGTCGNRVNWGQGVPGDPILALEKFLSLTCHPFSKATFPQEAGWH